MLEFYYISLSLFLVVIITIGFNALLKKTYPLTKLGFKDSLKVPFFISLWLFYVYEISSTGLLQSFELPPNIAIFLLIPTAIIITLFIRRYKNHPMMRVLPKSWAIYFQSFRVPVELIIWKTYLIGIFPIATTFEGYNYEIFVGASAPIIAYLVFKQKILPEIVAVVWNFVGLLILGIIISIVITSAFFPHLWGAETSLVKAEFGLFPYTLLAGFLAPMAIFMHVLSLSQLLRKNKAVS